MSTKGQRTGRPAGNDGNNRELILASAREEFSAKGFRGATLRSIAGRAGFDVALIAHYFDNKDGLFAATLTIPDGALAVLHTALTGNPETQGERLTRSYLSLWEDSATGIQMQVLARSALSNEAATASFRQVMMAALSGSAVAPLLGERQAGFSFAMSHLLGIAFARHLTRIPHIAELNFDALVVRVSPATQQYLAAAGSDTAF